METKEQRIEDLFITAFEGGSNYWAELRIRMPEKMTMSASELIFKNVMKGKEFRVFDCEDPKEVLGYLNKDNLYKGYELLQNQFEEHYADVISEQWDATTADVFFQLAILGEITFG